LKQLTTYDEYGWGYRPAASHNICTVTVYVGFNGTNTDALKMELRLGTTTVSSTDLSDQGTHVAWADNEYQISSDPQAVTYTFTPCAVVVGANWYDFVLYRTGANNGTNYYKMYVQGSGSPTCTGTACIYNGFITQRFNHGGNVVQKDGYLSTNAGSIVLNGTENFSAVTPNDATQSQCTPPSNVLDVGGGISYSLCYLFLPSQNVNLTPSIMTSNDSTANTHERSAEMLIKKLNAFM